MGTLTAGTHLRNAKAGQATAPPSPLSLQPLGTPCSGMEVGRAMTYDARRTMSATTDILRETTPHWIALLLCGCLNHKCLLPGESVGTSITKHTNTKRQSHVVELGANVVSVSERFCLGKKPSHTLE